MEYFERFRCVDMDILDSKTQWGALCATLAEKYAGDPTLIQSLGDLSINNNQITSLMRGDVAPTDELLAMVLYRAGIRDRHSIAQYMQAASSARRTLPSIDHHGQEYLAPEEKRKIKAIKKPRRKTASQRKINRAQAAAEWGKIEKICMANSPSFEGITLREYERDMGTTGAVLKRGIAKILRQLPQKQWPSMVAVIPKKPPLHSSVYISRLMIEKFREKKIVYDLIKPPEGWHTLSSLRVIFTDSSQTMQRRIDGAIKVLKKQGFHENEIIAIAHNKKRELVPFYRPAIEETLRKEMGVTTQHDRECLTQRPPSYLTITECLQLVGGEYHRTRGKIESYLSTLPEEKREGLLIEGRGRGGVVTQLFQRGALRDMEAQGYFQDQANYRVQPDKPDGWQSSSDLIKIYNGNKGKMIRIANAFKLAVEEHEGVEAAQGYVGHYRYKGKIGIFLHPSAVEMIETGYHGLTLTRR